MSADSSSSITMSIYLFGWLEKLATILFISFNLNLPFRVVTLLIYMSEIPLLDQFSYLLFQPWKYRQWKISKNLFIPFFHLSRQSGVSHTFDNLKIHRTIIIALLSNRLFFFLFLFFEGKVMGLDNTLFTFHYPIFKKSVLFDLCQKIRPYT